MSEQRKIYLNSRQAAAALDLAPEALTYARFHGAQFFRRNGNVERAGLIAWLREQIDEAQLAPDDERPLEFMFGWQRFGAEAVVERLGAARLYWPEARAKRWFSKVETAWNALRAVDQSIPALEVDWSHSPARMVGFHRKEWWTVARSEYDQHWSKEKYPSALIDESR